MADVVHPGWVTSKNDGERHFIGFGALCRLYGLNPQRTLDGRLMGVRMEQRPEDHTHYYPRSDGNYRKKADGPADA